MSSRTIVIIALRVFAAYIFLQMAAAIGMSIPVILNSPFDTFELVETYLFQAAVYFLISYLLYAYAGKIADILAKSVHKEKTKTRWTELELSTVLITVISIYTILSRIPVVIDQLNNLVIYFQNSAAEKQRLNWAVFGLLGALLQLIVASFLIYKARALSGYLINVQRKNAKRPLRS